MLNSQNLKILAEQARKELARRNLEDFLLYDGRGQWQTGRHLKKLCEKLQAVASGKIKRLMVFMPPRHGKSEVVSKKFPAWYLGNHPNNEVIISSYAADLALDFSRIARNTLREHGEGTFDVEVARDSSAVGRWGIEGHRGGLNAAGVGGPLTGRGAHVAIVDDPFKNWQEASSKTIRDNVWDWYRSVLRTRLAPGGSIILVMTRWHEDDLAGRLLREMQEGTGEDWEVLDLPAIAEDGDTLNREPGEVLWAERFPAHEYADVKKAIGTKLWTAMYQQKPRPDEGDIFKRKWWKFYTRMPERFDEQIQSWDCAFKDTKSSDYVVGQVWGRIAGDFYLCDLVRGQMDLPTTMKAIETLTAKWPKGAAKLVEDKANGPAVIQMLERKVPGLIAVNPEGGKVVRANAAAPVVESGNVYLPDPSIAPWVHDFIEEVSAFPNGANDDQVDSFTQAIIRFLEKVQRKFAIQPTVVGIKRR